MQPSPSRNKYCGKRIVYLVVYLLRRRTSFFRRYTTWKYLRAHRMSTYHKHPRCQWHLVSSIVLENRRQLGRSTHSVRSNVQLGTARYMYMGLRKCPFADWYYNSVQRHLFINGVRTITGGLLPQFFSKGIITEG